MNFIQIGNLKKAFGVQGFIRLKVEDKFLEDIIAAKVLFLEIKGQKVPFFIEKIQEEKELSIKLEEIDNKEEAHKLNNKTIFLRDSDLLASNQRKTQVKEQMDFLVGFELWDNEKGKIGEIEEVIEMPMQMLLSVKKEGKEILIPFVEQFIFEVLPGEEKIVMVLPEGLLDL